MHMDSVQPENTHAGREAAAGHTGSQCSPEITTMARQRQNVRQLLVDTCKNQEHFRDLKDRWLRPCQGLTSNPIYLGNLGELHLG